MIHRPLLLGGGLTNDTSSLTVGGGLTNDTSSLTVGGGGG